MANPVKIPKRRIVPWRGLIWQLFVIMILPLISGEKMVLVWAVSPGRDWVAAGASSTYGLVRHTLANALASGHIGYSGYASGPS